MILKFRKASSGDYNFYRELEKCYALYYHTKWDENFFIKDWDSTKNYLRIVLMDNKKIGCFSLENKKDYLYIEKLHVDKKYWNSGVGSYLLGYFNGIAKKRLRLHVRSDNPAVRLYQRFGYKIIGKAKKGKFLMEKVK